MADDIVVMNDQPKVEVNPMGLLQMAIQQKYDPDSIGKLAALVEHRQELDAKAAYFRDMNAAQGKMPAVVRTHDNKQTNSKYAPNENIVAMCKPVWSSYGFSISFGEGTSPLPNHMRMVADIMHVEGHKEQKFYDTPLDGVGIKGAQMMTPVHGKKSSASYAKRELICDIFCIITAGEDNDAVFKDTLIFEEQETIKKLLDERTVNLTKFFDWMEAQKVEDIERKRYEAAVIWLRKAPMKGGAK